MLIQNGWLKGAKHSPSPNFNARPAGQKINLLVIHNISLPPGEFGNDCVSQFFLNQLNCDTHPYFDTLRGLEVSAHCFIDRKGEITQFVSFDDRAWHAGISEFDGESNCNDFSIGIELEGTDDIDYTGAQYTALATLTKALNQKYSGISLDRIVGHSDIAPGRKTDPGDAFDWVYFQSCAGS